MAQSDRISSGGESDPQVELTAKPESAAPPPTHISSPQMVLPMMPPGASNMVGMSLRLGGGGPQNLLVPPEMLPPLTSSQVDAVLEIAKTKEGNEHLRLTEQIKQSGSAQSGVRWLVGASLLVVAAFVLAAVLQGHPELAEKVLLAIGTGVAGYVGGRGHERMKKHAD